jgi:short-subunit dehydrogenase
MALFGTRPRSRALGLLGLGVGLWLGKLLLDAARESRFSYRGKVVVVSGGSRGLGLVLARRLAVDGAKLVLVARDEDALTRARRELEAIGAEVLVVACDVGRGDQVDELLRRVRERFGGVDVLVNGAGTIGVGPLEAMEFDDFRRAMDTHFFGPLRLVLGVTDDMRARGGGRIVNIASIGSLVAVPHLASYTASKHALVGLSASLRAELTRANVLVTTVVPGLMRTGRPPNATFLGAAAAEYAWFEIPASVPLLSMSAERAARKILAACARGARSLHLGWTTKLAAFGASLFPATTAHLLSLVARALPGLPPHPAAAMLGRDTEAERT